jgi:hypothetical protein
MTRHIAFSSVLASALLSLGACRSLDRFDTGKDEAYCGALVSAPFAHEGFVPDNQPPALQMRLRLDAQRFTSQPGSISTDDANRGLCAPDPLLDDAPLRAIEEAFHDPLSTLEFGEGREHNLLVWVDSTCQGTMVGVVSLMKSDHVEVRLLKPAALPPANAKPDERPGFAQFQLRRRKGDCGF